jgi:hypothetical protein
VDLGEISVVPIPANPRVATTSIKGLDPSDLTDNELKTWARAAGLIAGERPMSPTALKIETDRIMRELCLNSETERRDANLPKRADMARIEALIGEPIDAAEKREQRDRELRRKADELRLEAAVGFDTSLIDTKDGKEPAARQAGGQGPRAVRTGFDGPTTERGLRVKEHDVAYNLAISREWRRFHARTSRYWPTAVSNAAAVPIWSQITTAPSTMSGNPTRRRLRLVTTSGRSQWLQSPSRLSLRSGVVVRPLPGDRRWEGQ